MATLTETAYYSRLTIKYGSIAIVALLIFRGLFLSFRSYWKKTHPPPPPPPTVAFGKLPKPVFPEQPNLPAISYKLETISGLLPDLESQAKVFFMPQPSDNLLAREKTKTWARSLGFIREPEEIDKYKYRFVSNSTPQTVLDVNFLTRNFAFSYDWKSDLDILAIGSPPQENQAISLARGFLQSADALSEDLALGLAEVSYLKYKDGDLTEAFFFSEANFTKVNLYRQDIEEIKILPANPKKSNIYVIVSGATKTNRGIIETSYTYNPISLENFATYPLKDINSGWSQLTASRAFIANLGDNPDGKVIIRNAYLAYYDSGIPQNFLQPVIVFEGDNDFFAYVPAISDNWLEQ